MLVVVRYHLRPVGTSNLLKQQEQYESDAIPSLCSLSITTYDNLQYTTTCKGYSIDATSEHCWTINHNYR
eukprot:scaffold4810_cov140-Amphora_coffeaeformis.AAC.1